jgi:phosphoglycolate phosphatase-like HAD superfamily hydrolase
MSHLFLFDIDFTLIRTAGVGRTAMNEVMHELYGVPHALSGVDLGGRTDRAILRDGLRNCGQELDDDAFEALIAEIESRYIPLLVRNLHQRGGWILPGVRRTLELVQTIPDVRIGIVTGNFRRAAEAKLRYFGLDHYFEDGGYADDAEARAELVRIAIGRLGGAPGGEYGVFVLGDTAHDILAAQANGAIAIGVATGSSSPEMLAMAGAAHVFNDLSEPDAMLSRLLGTNAGPAPC